MGYIYGSVKDGKLYSLEREEKTYTQGHTLTHGKMVPMFWGGANRQVGPTNSSNHDNLKQNSGRLIKFLTIDPDQHSVSAEGDVLTSNTDIEVNAPSGTGILYNSKYYYYKLQCSSLNFSALGVRENDLIDFVIPEDDIEESRYWAINSVVDEHTIELKRPWYVKNDNTGATKTLKFLTIVRPALYFDINRILGRTELPDPVLFLNARVNKFYVGYCANKDGYLTKLYSIDWPNDYNPTPEATLIKEWTSPKKGWYTPLAVYDPYRDVIWMHYIKPGTDYYHKARGFDLASSMGESSDFSDLSNPVPSPTYEIDYALAFTGVFPNPPDISSAAKVVMHPVPDGIWFIYPRIVSSGTLQNVTYCWAAVKYSFKTQSFISKHRFVVQDFYYPFFSFIIKKGKIYALYSRNEWLNSQLKYLVYPISEEGTSGQVTEPELIEDSYLYWKGTSNKLTGTAFNALPEITLGSSDAQSSGSGIYFGKSTTYQKTAGRDYYPEECYIKSIRCGLSKHGSPIGEARIRICPPTTLDQKPDDANGIQSLNSVDSSQLGTGCDHNSHWLFRFPASKISGLQHSVLEGTGGDDSNYYSWGSYTYQMQYHQAFCKNSGTWERFSGTSWYPRLETNILFEGPTTFRLDCLDLGSSYFTLGYSNTQQKYASAFIVTKRGYLKGIVIFLLTPQGSPGPLKVELYNVDDNKKPKDLLFTPSTRIQANAIGEYSSHFIEFGVWLDPGIYQLVFSIDNTYNQQNYHKLVLNGTSFWQFQWNGTNLTWNSASLSANVRLYWEFEDTYKTLASDFPIGNQWDYINSNQSRLSQGFNLTEKHWFHGVRFNISHRYNSSTDIRLCSKLYNADQNGKPQDDAIATSTNVIFPNDFQYNGNAAYMDVVFNYNNILLNPGNYAVSIEVEYGSSGGWNIDKTALDSGAYYQYPHLLHVSRYGNQWYIYATPDRLHCRLLFDDLNICTPQIVPESTMAAEISDTKTSSPIFGSYTATFHAGSTQYLVDQDNNLVTSSEPEEVIATLSGSPVRTYALDAINTRVIATDGTNTYIYKVGNAVTLEKTINSFVGVTGAMLNRVEYIFGNTPEGSPKYIDLSIDKSYDLLLDAELVDACADDSNYYCCTNHSIYKITNKTVSKVLTDLVKSFTHMASCNGVIAITTTNALYELREGSLRLTKIFNSTVLDLVTDGNELYAVTERND